MQDKSNSTHIKFGQNIKSDTYCNTISLSKMFCYIILIIDMVCNSIKVYKFGGQR